MTCRIAIISRYYPRRPLLPTRPHAPTQSNFRRVHRSASSRTYTGWAGKRLSKMRITQEASAVIRAVVHKCSEPRQLKSYEEQTRDLEPEARHLITEGKYQSIAFARLKSIINAGGNKHMLTYFPQSWHSASVHSIDLQRLQTHLK